MEDFPDLALAPCLSASRRLSSFASPGQMFRRRTGALPPAGWEPARLCGNSHCVNEAHVGLLPRSYLRGKLFFVSSIPGYVDAVSVENILFLIRYSGIASDVLAVRFGLRPDFVTVVKNAGLHSLDAYIRHVWPVESPIHIGERDISGVLRRLEADRRISVLQPNNARMTSRMLSPGEASLCLDDLDSDGCISRLKFNVLDWMYPIAGNMQLPLFVVARLYYDLGRVNMDWRGISAHITTRVNLVSIIFDVDRERSDRSALYRCRQY